MHKGNTFHPETATPQQMITAPGLPPAIFWLWLLALSPSEILSLDWTGHCAISLQIEAQINCGTGELSKQFRNRN